MSLTHKALLFAAWWPATQLAAQAPSWDRYQRFPELAESLSVRWPSVVVIRDTTVVAANLFPADTSRFSRKDTFVIVRAPGGSLGRPAGPFSFAHPQIASDSRGAIHMVWAEPRDTTSSFAKWLGAPASLWHSVHRDGRWSAPRQLLTGTVLTWGSDARGIVCDSAGRLHVVLPASLPNELAIVYLRLRPSGDIEHELHWAGGSYASITSLGGDSLIVAYATADALTPRGGSALFARVTGNSGLRWASPVLVTRSEQRNVSPPIVERSNSELHFMWVEAHRVGEAQAQIRAFVSRSGGSAWTEVSTRLPVGGFPFRLISAGAACGGYLALLEFVEQPSTDPHLRLLAFRLRDSQLLGAKAFAQLEAAANAGIAPVGDSLRIVFSAVRPGEQTVMTATATGRACAAM